MPISSALDTGFVPASISWHNINVFSEPETGILAMCKPKRPSTQIIKNVSGSVRAGSTLAIMGSSGAGKTTLLNVLTARNLANFRVEGCVKINGQIADVNLITTMSAYVQQQDLFIATLTVREHLIFQAMVRMDNSLTDDQKVERINEIMKELSLDKCADTLVGGTLATGKGISGGELKRLAFAVEILTNPSIMFCDEPTSGLDSFMAANLVTYLNKMASAGRTIICTIHQPASEVFSLFKNLLLMADGRVAYMGELSGALPYFKELGMNCPENYNPADFYIRELAVYPGKEAACKKKLNRICDFFDQTHPQPDLSQHRQTTFVNKEVTISPYKATCLSQYQALAWRSFLITLREPLLTYVRVGQAIVVSIIIGLFFLHQNYDQRGMMNINGALFLFLINLSLQNAFAVVNVFCQELPIFLREHSSGMYRVDAYFICKNLAESPVFVLIPICAGAINYYMIGYYPSFDAFLYYVMVGVLISLVGVSYGYCISCICNNTDLALSVGPPIMVPLQLLGGYYLNSKTVPGFLRWAEFLSWFQYGFDLLIQNQWTDVRYIDCINLADNNTSFGSTTTHHPFNFTTLAPVSEPPREVSGMCIASGADVIEFLNQGRRSQYVDFIALIIIMLALRIIAYLALLIRTIYNR